MVNEQSAVAPRLTVSAADVERMMDRLLLTEGDRRTKLSAFWALLILATIIAASGVIADSTAAVIGAMIVAPLMTPILGTALSIVLARRQLILVNLGLVLVGALTVVVIAAISLLGNGVSNTFGTITGKLN